MSIRRPESKRDAQRRGALICGAYGLGNAGDDAILEAIIQEMREIDADMPIWVLSRSPKKTRERFGIEAVHTFNIFRFRRIMRKTRLYLSGGGSLIQDATSSRSLWYYLASIAMAKRLGNKVLMYGCGVGPVRRAINRKFSAAVLNKYVDAITLREDSSREELQRLGVTLPEIIIASDPVLALSAAPEEETAAFLTGNGIDPGGRYICFALRNWPGFSKKAAIFAAAATYAYRQHGLTPVFVAINHRGDGDAADAVISLLDIPYHAVREPLASGIAIGLMSRMSVVLAMRLHGLVFAASRGVPLIGVDYDPKVTAFLRYAGQDMYIPFSDTDEPGLCGFIDRAAACVSDRERLRENVSRLAEMERRNVETARRLYSGAEILSDEDSKLKRIAIFQSDLRVGGIQKALVNILNAIDYTRCSVDLYLFDNERFFELFEKPHLRVRYLKPYPYINRFFYFGFLRRLLKAPGEGRVYDIAIDFNSYRNECAVGALGVNAKKRVMWIHNDVEIKLKNEPKYRILWHFFKKKILDYDEFCAVSPGVIDGFRRASGLTDKMITPIPNTIDTAEIFRKAAEPVDFAVDPACYNLCTMGRICRQKGFDLLMEYIAHVVPHRPDLRLYLLGDGPDREKLSHQISRLGLENVVTLLGNQSNPFPYVAQMDGFTLTSRYEGQGIVIREAEALGLELFIAKNLEKYNPGVPVVDDVAQALLRARRREKIYNDLADYNEGIRKNLFRVLELEEP